MYRRVNVAKVNTIPPQLDKNILYFTKKDQVLNLVLADDTESRPAVANRTVILSGPREIYATTDGTNYSPIPTNYTIENFDSFMDYDVTVSRGTVNRTGNTITVSPDGALGDLYLGVNGEYSKIIVRLKGVIKPTMLYPFQHGMGVTPTFTARITPFSSGDAFASCQNTEYQTAEDLDFTVNVQTVTLDIDVESTVLVRNNPGMTLFIRARYIGSMTGPGPWSEVIEFKIKETIPFFTETYEMTRIDPSLNCYFGGDIRISKNGEVAVISATGAINGKGALHILKRYDDIWVNEEIIVLDEAQVSTAFGSAIDISADGKYIACTHPRSVTTPGKVYVYEKGDEFWELKDIIESPTPTPDEFFGFYLSFSDDGLYLAIAGQGEDSTVVDSGAIYIYKLGNLVWELKQKIKAQTPSASTRFAASLKISPNGSYLALPELLGGTNSSGIINIWLRSGETWSFQQAIPNPDLLTNARLGRVVLFNQDASLMIASATDVSQNRLYVFSRSGAIWTHRSTFDPVVNGLTTLTGQFGFSLSGNSDLSLIIVGARQHNSGDGAVFAFKRNGYNLELVQKITNINAASGERLGNSVAYAEATETLLVGSTLASVGGFAAAGKVNIFN